MKLMGHTSFPQKRPLLVLFSCSWTDALADRLSCNPVQSNLVSCTEGDLTARYNLIRTLDDEGYPHALVEIHGLWPELRRVCKRSEDLHADLRITPIASPPLRSLRRHSNHQRHESPHPFKALRAIERSTSLLGCC